MTEAEVRSRPAGVPLLVGYGAGLNSTALLIGLRERGIRPDWINFADTGDEKPETYAFLPIFAKWLHGAGFPSITVVKKTGRIGDVSLEQESLRRKTLPSRAFGLSSCAHRWKIEPQEKFVNHLPEARAAWKAGYKVIKALGIDAGETRPTPDDDKKYAYWYPLVEWGWDRDLCAAAVSRAGLPMPVKSACFYCPSSKKREVLQLKVKHPDLFARAVAMERNAAPNLRDVKGLGRTWSWEMLGVADKRQLSLFREAPVEPCMMCVDGDAEAA